MASLIDLDRVYLKNAYNLASLSYAKKRKVGCIIVKDQRQISDGINGTLSGSDNKCEDLDLSGNLKTNKYVLHAEFNAICKLASSTDSSEGATLYVTYAPCFYCANMIIAAKIIRVVYSEIKHKEGIEHIKNYEKRKIQVVHFPENHIMNV